MNSKQWLEVTVKHQTLYWVFVRKPKVTGKFNNIAGCLKPNLQEQNEDQKIQGTQEIRNRERQEMEKPKIRNEEVKKGSEMEKFWEQEL